MYPLYTGSTINTIEKSILLELAFKIFIPRPTECLHLFAGALFDENDDQYKELIEKSEGFIMLSLLCILLTRYRLRKYPQQPNSLSLYCLRI
jgi:hypothetical protein